MKKKISIYFVILLLLAVVSMAADDARVSRLYLSPQAGETVLKVAVSGPFQFSHETAEAKDDKPFRIVIDIFPAVHDLGAKSFEELPATIINSIRTSQYSVSPEKIVRVVCDLDRTTLYRVEKKDNFVYLYLPDKESGNFIAWSSPQESPLLATSPAEDARAENKSSAARSKVVTSTSETQVKTAPKQAATTPTAKDPAEKPKNIPETPTARYYQPEKSDEFDREKTLASDEVTKPPVVKTEPASNKAETPEKPVVSQIANETKPVEVAQTSKPVQKKEEMPVVKEKAKPKTVAAPAENNKKNEVPAPAPVVATKPAPKAEEVASSADEKVDSDDDAKKPTSRFRRKPAFPNKLKGTIVAEFPKRIVMEYRPGTARDPFANLLAETKKSSSPIEKKIPDVETSRLVGVLESSNGEKRALLEDMEGYGYILKTGDKIKKGYVGKIYADKAFFRLFEYGWSRTVALYLGIN